MKKLKKLSALALLAVGFALVFGGCKNSSSGTTDTDDDKKKQEEELDKTDEVVTVSEPEFTVWYGCKVNKNILDFTDEQDENKLNCNGGAYYKGRVLSDYSGVKITVKGSYDTEPENGMKFCVKIYDSVNNKYADLGYPTINEANKSQTFTYENVAEKLEDSEVEKPGYLCLTNNSNNGDWSGELKWGYWSLTVEKIEFIP